MSEPVPAPDSPGFRRALGNLPTGVTVVTARGENGPAGATANAVASLSLDPPLMLAALDRGSRTLDAVRRSRRFGVNVLAAAQGNLAERFSTKHPHHHKWAGVSWSERAGVPMIDGTVLWIACELRDLHDGGDHEIATGMVLDLATTEGEPLVFHRGSYRGLGGSEREESPG